MIEGILAVAVLLALGVVARAALPPLRWLYIPASVVGGLIGLALLQGLGRADVTAEWSDALSARIGSWPGVLIAVVFAGLLLEHPGRSAGRAARAALQAGVYAWIVIVGQIALGVVVTWLVLAPMFDVPILFGQLIEAGFGGGHGTAASLGTIFATESMNWPEGRDLAFASATVGLVYGVVSGIAFVNLGVRRGWTSARDARLRATGGLEARNDPRPIAWGRIAPEVLDPLALPMILLAVAFGLGMALQAGFTALASVVLPEAWRAYAGNVPLFLFTLFGGWGLRWALTLIGFGDLIDTGSIKRLVGAAMEVLIVAAMASLRLEAIAAALAPLAILFVVAFAWTAFCLLVIAPRVLPRDRWFELGILNYGMSTATTAQGMMLLRIVDEDLESGAAEDYALAAPLSAPFIGGGVITVAMPLALTTMAVPLVVLALVGVLVVAGGLAIALRER